MREETQNSSNREASGALEKGPVANSLPFFEFKGF